MSLEPVAAAVPDAVQGLAYVGAAVGTAVAAFLGWRKMNPDKAQAPPASNEISQVHLLLLAQQTLDVLRSLDEKAGAISNELPRLNRKITELEDAVRHTGGVKP